VQLVKTFKLALANIKGPNLVDLLKPEPAEKSTESKIPTKKNDPTATPKPDNKEKAGTITPLKSAKKPSDAKKDASAPVETSVKKQKPEAT